MNGQFLSFLKIYKDEDHNFQLSIIPVLGHQEMEEDSHLKPRKVCTNTEPQSGSKGNEILRASNWFRKILHDTF